MGCAFCSPGVQPTEPESLDRPWPSREEPPLDGCHGPRNLFQPLECGDARVVGQVPRSLSNTVNERVWTSVFVLLAVTWTSSVSSPSP